MPDKIALHIDGKKIKKFRSYQVEADIYTADDMFSLETAVDQEVPEGALCELYVNGQLELTGISDMIDEFCDKKGRKMTINGRDLMGLLVDSYVEEFVTTDLNLKELAEKLLAKVPFIKRKNVVYQAGVVGASARADAEASVFGGNDESAQTEPGQTIFEVLKAKALSRGVIFWAKADGTPVFGRPKAKGKPLYRLVRRLDGVGNNVLEGRRIRDTSKRYSTIRVTGSNQGDGGLGAEAVAREAVVTDDTVPFHKPYVVCDGNNDNNPADQARLLMERQRAQGLQFIYKVARHSQNGKNWMINELCEIEDEALKVHGTFLIYGRSYELNKKDGKITVLKLGLPGLIR